MKIVRLALWSTSLTYNMKKANNWYPVQVWLMTVVILGPILLLISLLKNIHDFRDFTQELAFMILSILYGLIYSLPVLAIDFLIFKFSVHRNYSELLIKLILIVVSTIGIIVSLQLVAPDAIFVVYLCYSVALVISCIIMKPYKQ